MCNSFVKKRLFLSIEGRQNYTHL